MKPLTVVLFLFLAACATPVQHNTPSGKPEATIAGVKPGDVKSAIINEMMSWGYSITADSDYVLAMDRPIDSVLASAFFGSDYDSQPSARVTYTFAEIGDSVRVIADIKIVTNPHSAFERFTDATNNADSVGIQRLLDRIRSDLTQE